MPVLALLQLSDSFAAFWPELAGELGLELVAVTPSDPPPVGAVALLLAAGGEEDRALDLLLSIPGRGTTATFVVGSRTSHRFAAEAVRGGAADYFALPADIDLLRRTLGSRAEAARHRAVAAPAESDAFQALLGQSAPMHRVLETARRVAQHGDVTVLIRGDTGTGKELLARALHDGGPRQAGPFVAVNCAAIPAHLLESELFGHERGAFTDAHRTKRGLFEEAHAGTLFLDEIGHLPLALQGKLLRALEEKRVRRVGATDSRPVDARIVAATHVDLARAVASGEFREDLYYRLNVIVLELPPLRDRGADVALLAEAFVETLARRYGIATPRLSTDVRTALMAHDWPGNVRELRHAIERALLLSEPGTIDPATLLPPTPARPVAAGGARAPLAVIIATAVREAIERHGGNKSAAARELGISRQRLQRILEGADDRGD